MNFIHKVPLAPSKCLSKWIKVDKWDNFQNSSLKKKILFYISIFIYRAEILKIVGFLVEMMTPKSPFEINCLLVSILKALGKILIEPVYCSSIVQYVLLYIVNAACRV